MPYNYSSKSKSKLETCHKDIQLIFNEVIKTFDCTILEGHRSLERQLKLYNQGKSQINGVDKKGKHNYLPSKAVDVVAYPINWNDTNTHYYFAGYVKGIAQILYDEGKISHKIRNGADWNCNNNIHDQNFNDLVHFEII